MPSAWPEQIPMLSMSYVQLSYLIRVAFDTVSSQLRFCLEFESYGNFFNPSRADPANMGHSPATGNSYLTLPGQAQSFLTLTTCVMTTACNIVRPKEIMGEPRRVISGIPHSFEFQRMEAAILAAFHEDSASAQLAQDAITFNTAKAGAGCKLQNLSPFHVAHVLQPPAVHQPKTRPKCFDRPLGLADPPPYSLGPG